MRIVYALLFSCILCGCTPSPPAPREGDVYENKLTRERIEIDVVGGCLDIRDAAERNLAFWRDRRDRGEASDGIVLIGSRFPVLSPDSLATDCVAYEKKSVVSAAPGREIVIDGTGHARVPIRELHILSRRELEQRFTRID